MIIKYIVHCLIDNETKKFTPVGLLIGTEKKLEYLGVNADEVHKKRLWFLGIKATLCLAFSKLSSRDGTPLLFPRIIRA